MKKQNYPSYNSIEKHSRLENTPRFGQESHKTKQNPAQSTCLLSIIHTKGGAHGRYFADDAFWLKVYWDLILRFEHC